MNEIPKHERLLRKQLVCQQLFGTRRQRQIEQLFRSGNYLAESRCFAIAENAAPVISGDLAHGHGLRKEHGRVGFVARSKANELDWHKGGVRILLLFVSQPLGPEGVGNHYFEVAIWVAVLGVHREDCKVLNIVAAHQIGPKQLERCIKIWLCEAAFSPSLNVFDCLI